MTQQQIDATVTNGMTEQQIEEYFRQTAGSRVQTVQPGDNPNQDRASAQVVWGALPWLQAGWDPLTKTPTSASLPGRPH
jgi:hypothetical protein